MNVYTGMGHKLDESFKSLISFGCNGYFPLFDENWDDLHVYIGKARLSSKERQEAMNLINKMSVHKNIERKKIVMSSFKDADRKLLMKLFMEMVEGRMQDLKVPVQ